MDVSSMDKARYQSSIFSGAIPAIEAITRSNATLDVYKRQLLLRPVAVGIVDILGQPVLDRPIPRPGHRLPLLQQPSRPVVGIQCPDPGLVGFSGQIALCGDCLLYTSRALKGHPS